MSPESWLQHLNLGVLEMEFPPACPHILVVGMMGDPETPTGQQGMVPDAVSQHRGAPSGF